MATARKLLSLLGKPITGAALRGVVAADNLKSSKDRDLKEGLPVTWNFIGKKAGYEISAEDGRVVAVFLYVEKADGFAAFPASLPYDVPRDASRKDVRRVLGKPECSGNAYNDKILGPQGAWDRFAMDSVRIHFEYTVPGLQIGRVTLMTEDSAP
jgi:hypothetical protein